MNVLDFGGYRYKWNVDFPSLSVLRADSMFLDTSQESWTSCDDRESLLVRKLFEMAGGDMVDASEVTGEAACFAGWRFCLKKGSDKNEDDVEVFQLDHVNDVWLRVDGAEKGLAIEAFRLRRQVEELSRELSYNRTKKEFWHQTASGYRQAVDEALAKVLKLENQLRVEPPEVSDDGFAYVEVEVRDNVTCDDLFTYEAEVVPSIGEMIDVDGKTYRVRDVSHYVPGDRQKGVCLWVERLAD
jgi:hypothetical protein